MACLFTIFIMRSVSGKEGIVVILFFLSLLMDCNT